MRYVDGMCLAENPSVRYYDTESVAASYKPLGTGVLGLSGSVSAEDRL